MSTLTKVPPIGEERERELLKDATTYVYRETSQGPVHAHFFFPPGYDPSEPRTTIVFFPGGFWETPMRTQFVPHCNHFASRGAICVAAETRVSSKHDTGPLEGIDDAHALLLWIKMNAVALGVDVDRLIAGGAAGGAAAALTAAMPKEVKHQGDIDCRPRALVLFSPLVDTTPRTAAGKRFPDKKSAKLFSPSKHIRKKLPPSILFHGKNDRVIPFDDTLSFHRAMKRKRNVCELVDFEAAEHSFFNFNVSHLHFELTVEAADRFLVEQGFLAPQVEDSLV